MPLKQSIKEAVIVSALKRKLKAQPFDLEAYERHTLPAGAPPLISNSYYFGGSNTAGTSLVFRFGLRSHLSECFVLFTHEGRFFVGSSQQFGPDECPVRVECLEPGRRWRCLFDGQMTDTATGQVQPARFDLEWKARLPIFDSTSDGDPRGFARAFARQKWNKAFFAQFREGDTGMDASDSSAQHHYEQTGRFCGSFVIGDETFNIDLPACRDHSFGKRDWGYMCNHIWLMPITDDGRTLNLQLVNYPTANGICVGYTDLYTPQNVSLNRYAIRHYDHNGGLGTDRMEIDLFFNDGNTYHVEATRTHNLLTPFDGGRFYFQEGLADYRINGIPARGTIEYGFNQDPARWGNY